MLRSVRRGSAGVVYCDVASTAPEGARPVGHLARCDVAGLSGTRAGDGARKCSLWRLPRPWNDGARLSGPSAAYSFTRPQPGMEAVEEAGQVLDALEGLHEGR